jgi:hypothetical protein
MTTSHEFTRKLENQATHLDYYPHWLDNLADDVILQGAVFNGDYRSRIRGSEAYHPSGVEIYNFVVVYFNGEGETSQLVMNHRPQSAALLFSSLLAEHFGDAFDPDLFYRGDVHAHLLDRDLSRGLWSPSSR